mgnify:CR=1 FL=1
MSPRKETVERLNTLVSKLDLARQEEMSNLLNKKVNSVDDVANILGVCEETVRRAIRNGRLKAFRVAGAKRGALKITQEELDRFMGQGITGEPAKDL